MIDLIKPFPGESEDSFTKRNAYYIRILRPRLLYGENLIKLYTPNGVPITESDKEEIDAFVTIFELYALLQDQNDQGQYLNEKSIRDTAELNRTLMGTLQTVANHCEGIKRAKTIEERRQQITSFSQYLKDKKHKKSLELLKKMDPETIITDSAYFSAIRSYPKNSKAQKKEYPSLSDESSSLSFTDEEKRALEAYKNHRWI